MATRAEAGEAIMDTKALYWAGKGFLLLEKKASQLRRENLSTFLFALLKSLKCVISTRNGSLAGFYLDFDSLCRVCAYECCLY